jgi:hypothetical protein
MSNWVVNFLSVEHVPVNVTDAGQPLTGWKYIILPTYQAPTAVTQFVGVPTELEGQLGILIGPGTGQVLAPGEYAVWVRYESTPEIPVLPVVGRIIVRQGVAP